MDPATLIGIILGFGLILGSILMSGSLGPFIDPPSMMIVFGGSIAVTLIMESMQNVKAAFSVAKNAFKTKGGKASETIKVILELSNAARREGILALENKKVDDTFLQKGLRMAVDGIPREEIRETLSAELVAMSERHSRGVKLFKFVGAMAPAMGMIGTLIGLVQMLQALDDPSAIGPAMAVALLTTLYGAILANIICIPIAEKLDRRSSEESANMKVVIEGIDSIVKGHNAAVIKDRLEARLAPKHREQEAA
ncbi:MAG: MotA/TolQ/ExbB proton channel family protein [Polyangiaceae bacterium]|nr:MotA/TolQ/ExbB proton channel family protein [Myxococcales bacterium]MCB9587247.1 MotA/TolQ/ExbB proton channel family protein [Polyangiaceae bacterium]MCB9609370.1 MotA/TolQ/ExbB proton channel family protein [Polyangiaceae bacterium]